ncbi:MAG TPA: NfeD family protein [Acidimicrobiia bacterium]|nr:NfeD family protein [Acidimicrobiia bacterium]
MQRPRRHRRLVTALVLVCGAGVLALESSAVASDARDGQRGVLVVQVEGSIDPPNAELIRDAIQRANDDALTLVILQIDSKGALGAPVGDVVRSIRGSAVPVVAWVGPTGARAEGGAALLVEAAHVAFVAPSSEIGTAHPVRLDDPDASSVAEVRRELVRLAEVNDRDPAGAARLASSSFGPRAAATAGATNGVRPTVGEVIVTLDGKTLETATGPVEVSTAKVTGEGRDRRREPNQEVAFSGLDVGGEVRHALLGPSLVYFLLVAGLALIVFEFFAASVGFATAVGAISVVGAGYGFGVLPVRWWALALLVVASFGFSVDAQAGGLGPWTGIGVASMFAGSFFLYAGASGLAPPWWLLVLVSGGATVFYVFAIPPFLRARFSTPTLGREGMIAEMGSADTPIDPVGVVTVRGAQWRARVNRATPIEAGDTVRVVSVQGLELEVEPEEGGAQDYRERSRKRRRSGSEDDV